METGNDYQVIVNASKNGCSQRTYQTRHNLAWTFRSFSHQCPQSTPCNHHRQWCRFSPKQCHCLNCGGGSHTQSEHTPRFCVSSHTRFCTAVRLPPPCTEDVEPYCIGCQDGGRLFDHALLHKQSSFCSLGQHYSTLECNQGACMTD